MPYFSMKRLSFCKQCKHLCGSITVSLGKHKNMLTVNTFCMDGGNSCIFMTDLKSIYDIVKRKDIEWWIGLRPKRKIEILKEHITDIVRTDDDCEFKVEVLMESWNDEEEQNNGQQETGEGGEKDSDHQDGDRHILGDSD